MVERPRREPEIPLAAVALDKKGEALSQLLPEVLKEFSPEIGAAVDEVVVTVQPQQVPEVCRILKDDSRLDFNYLRSLSVVDYEDRFEVVYHLFSLDKRHKMVVKSSLPYEDPRVPTLIPVFPGANWFEREGHDLFGVVFEGHPDMAPLLLYEGFEGYPGRKSFPLHEYDEW